MMMISITVGEAGILVICWVSNRGSALIEMNVLNIMAPIKTKRIKLVVFAVSFSAAKRLDQVSRRLIREIARAPKAPIDPASEGAKTPKYSPPITRMKSPSIPQTPLKETTFSFHEKLSEAGGPNLGFIRHIRYIGIMNNEASINPGIIPAMNKSPMDVSVTIP